jgi:hypothetical protein
MNESIQHLFLTSQMLDLYGDRAVDVSFNLPPPLNVNYMFHTWLHVLDKKLKYQILVWAWALCCAI